MSIKLLLSLGDLGHRTFEYIHCDEQGDESWRRQRSHSSPTIHDNTTAAAAALPHCLV